MALALQYHFTRADIALPDLCLKGGIMRKTTLLSVLILGLTTITGFQNCSPSQVSNAGNSTLPTSNSSKSSNGDTVVDQASSYTSIAFEQEVSGNGGKKSTLHLKVDLLNGDMSIKKTQGLIFQTNAPTLAESSCSLSDERYASLKSLISVARVCKQADDLPKDSVQCMALAVSDIQLSSPENGSVEELRQGICGDSVYLCEGLDEKFRDLLKDLTTNPPANCSLDNAQQ